MNPYDDDSMARRARPSQPSWEDDFPGGHDPGAAYPSAGRAPVGRAQVGRATVSGGPGPSSTPDSYGSTFEPLAPRSPDPYAFDPYASGPDPYAAGPDPYSPHYGDNSPMSPAAGRATVGRASVRPVSPGGPGGYGGGRGPGGRGPGGPGGRGPFDRGGPDGPDDEDGFGDGGPGGPGRGNRKRGPVDPKKAKMARWRNISIAAFAVFIMLAGAGVVGGTYYVGSVPTPSELHLPESTTVYYADGKSVMARLGSENRTIMDYAEMNDAVKHTIVAAEDQTFWTNEGVDFKGVLRAAWNNFTGGSQQGASTITQQYARVAFDLSGSTYSRKLREAVMAWKLSDEYKKEEILGFYLNTVPFGRGAYGIEAAAQAYFGKTVSNKAKPEQQLTIAEAAVIVSMVKQPEPDPADPINYPGYDPKRSKNAEANAKALENSKGRWNYVIKSGMVETGRLMTEQAEKLVYPLEQIKPYVPGAEGLSSPSGLAVQHALSELAQSETFKKLGKTEVWDYIRNGGFRIITTINKPAQDAAIAAADDTKATSPMNKQPKGLQAALVAVQPGTGRVLAYFGGHNGAGADYAGWYYDEEGDAKGIGRYPPGSSFKVYTLAAAIKEGISLDSYWDSKSGTVFPSRPDNPIRNASSCTAPYGTKNGPCTLLGSTVASLNVPFYAVTEAIGPGKVLAMARDAGVASMWDDNRKRIDFEKVPNVEEEGRKYFDIEVGIGQYPVTVMDHANGIATFAAGGRPAKAHFVMKVFKGKDPVYSETLPAGDNRILNEYQNNDLTYALSKVNASRLDLQGWDSAGKTGTWEYNGSAVENAHAWMVGYTKKIAAAVWVGNEKKEAAIKMANGKNIFGGDLPAPIWRQFMEAATKNMKLSSEGAQFTKTPFTGDPGRGNIASPTPEVIIEPTDKPGHGNGNGGGPGPDPSPSDLVTPPPTGGGNGGGRPRSGG